MPELLDTYNQYSFSTALPDDRSQSATPAVLLPTTPPPLASSDTQWSRMYRGLTAERQRELLEQAVIAVGEVKFRGLHKEPLLAELRRGLAGELPTSSSAKFFLMQAAIGPDRFVFRCNNWYYPLVHACSKFPHKCTTLKPDGAIAIEQMCHKGCAGIDNPWNPLKGRGAYKKPQLIAMVGQLFGEVPPRAKADELYAMLVGQFKPLEQP